MSTAEITTLTKQYKDLHHDVNNLRQSTKNVEKSLQRMENDFQKSLDKIHMGLFGDVELSHTGVIKIIADYKIVIEAIKKDVADARTQKETDAKVLKAHKWWATGIAAIIGGGIGTIFNYFLNK